MQTRGKRGQKSQNYADVICVWPPKMLRSRMKLLLLIFLLYSDAAVGSLLSVDDGGVYSGITVRIGDDVPRQYCRRVIDGVQVGERVQ